VRRRQRRIRIGGTEMLVIDLTLPLREDVEPYPGDPRPRKKVFSAIKTSGCQHHLYTLSDHSFRPHGDAPRHQNPSLQKKGFEVFDIGFSFNHACMIDLSGMPEAAGDGGIRWLVEVEERHLIPHASLIAKRRAVVIRTGYDRWLEANRPHRRKNIPYLSKGAARMLAGLKNLRVIGTDSLTVDAQGSRYVHQKFKDRLIVESMVNLYSIPKANRLAFDLQTSPIAIVGSTGGPVAAYAFIKTKKAGL